VALYDSALQRAEPLGDAVARATADLHTGLSEIDCELGDATSALRHLELAATLGERASMGESGYRWFVAMSRVAVAEGDPDSAVTLLDQAEQLYRPSFFPDVRPIGAMRARVWIGQGRLSDAEAWSRARGLTVTDPVSYLREFDHLTLVRLLVAQHRQDPQPGGLDPADALLHRLAETAESAGRAGSLLEIRIMQGLVRDAAGTRSEALEHLARGWSEAPEPDRYVRLFLDEGEQMAALLADAVAPTSLRDHARRLLSIRVNAVEGNSAPSTRTSSGAAPALSERELQVLRLLDSELTGPELARELFISHNTLRTHTKSIFTKLDVTSRRAAVRRAREIGLM
jgi:LuxR family maltose regulon positive regulatory protein